VINTLTKSTGLKSMPGKKIVYLETVVIFTPSKNS